MIDEFPFLAKAAPALPSIIQRALDPAARRHNTPVRLLLCGSALSFMGGPPAGNAPLRGRAGVELVVPTLDYRLAARFWDITDPRTAALTHAIVGGTPAYRREFTQGDTPANPGDFDDWVTRAVLNPGRPLLREARYLLAEEPELHDTALYHSVLAAIATGNAARGGIADYLGRKSTDLAHPLHVLEDVGLIRHEPDAFRRNRSAHRIAEPLVTFHHSVMRPHWGDLERPGRAPAVWQRAQPTFRSKVLGPHFEALCREWARWHASPETYGGHPAHVAAGTVNDPAARTSHEVDVAVHGPGDAHPDRVGLLAIGEAKWNERLGVSHLERLQHIRGLLTARGAAPGQTRLLCFSGRFHRRAPQSRRTRPDDPTRGPGTPLPRRVGRVGPDVVPGMRWAGGSGQKEQMGEGSIRAVGWAQSFPISGGVRAGRRWARRHVEALEWTREAPETVDAIVLTVSELITNAHVHAHSGAQVTLTWDSRCLHVSVHDADSGEPASPAPDDERTSGRGLLLVDALADSWETRQQTGGKTVTACFYPPGHPDPHPPGEH